MVQHAHRSSQEGVPQHPPPAGWRNPRIPSTQRYCHARCDIGLSPHGVGEDATLRPCRLNIRTVLQDDAAFANRWSRELSEADRDRVAFWEPSSTARVYRDLGLELDSVKTLWTSATIYTISQQSLLGRN